MNIIIETERLLLREFTGEDAHFIFKLNQDPDVTRYTMDPINDLEQAKQVLENILIPQYALYRHGRWAVLCKSDLRFIGWCGLKAIPERSEIDLGYRFLQSEWGKDLQLKLHMPVLIMDLQMLGYPE